MKIAITYEYPTAYGNPIRKVYVAGTFAEAEDVCKRVEALKDEGYKLIDVTREE